jgi:hypothetical protein
MDGFLYITRIWRSKRIPLCELISVAGKIGEIRLRDSRLPPGGSSIALRQAELALLLDDLANVLKGCPSYLVLSPSSNNFAQNTTFPDNFFNGILEYAEGSRLITEEPHKAFIIQQANLYITQACQPVCSQADRSCVSN